MVQRSLSQWLEYLENLHPSAIDMGLERSQSVLRQLGLGKLAERIVTVTGTNGKGSTCAFLASLFQVQGLRVGVYSSPHLLRYNERVQIAGQEVADEQLCEAFAAVEAARGDTSLTYFEMGTLAAFWLFERAGLDVVVLEVGLGGRLDAVNLVDADVAVITSIGVDHVDYLGNTRESVAYEKAGIMREGRPAVCGDLAAPSPLIERAQALRAPLLRRGQQFDLSIEPTCWSWRGIGSDGQPCELANLPLLDLPMDNAAVALQAYALCEDGSLDRAAICGALLNTRMTGRLDRRRLVWRGKPLTLMLDVAHNPHAAAYLANILDRDPAPRLAVFGLLADKDLAGVIDPLINLFQSWAVAELHTSRARASESIAEGLRQHGAKAEVFVDIASALSAQCERAQPGTEIVLFGSFFCVAAALEWLHNLPSNQ